MKTILSYFKKHILSILLLIAVLGAQVQFELLLPQYTSDIVNVGIQQDGIKDSIPKVIDENTYGVLLSLSDQKDKSSIAKSYELWIPKSKDSKNQNIKKDNPNSKLVNTDKYNINYYLLKKNVDTKALELHMNNAFVKYAEYMNNSMATDKKSQWSAMSKEKVPDFMKKQIGVKGVSTIYKKNGIDINKMQKNYLWKNGIVMLLIALATGLLSIVVSLISARVSSKVSKDLRQDSFDKVLSFSNHEMGKFSIASLISRCTNDIQQIQQSSVMGLRFLFYGPIMAIGAFFKVFKLDVSMVWIIVLAIAATLVFIFLIMRQALPKFKAIQKIVDKLNLVTREFISGIEVNRVFRTNKYELDKFDDVNKELTDTTLFISRLMSFMQPIMMLVMNGATLLIVWVGAKSIEAGNIQVGDMMAFIQYAIQIIMAFLFISMMSIILPRAMISANRIEEVVTSDIAIKDNGTVTKFNEEGRIEFDNVSFKYDGAPENVIENINFEASKGKTTAIIGSTGSGKTTIVNMIPRFLDATEGSVKLNGVDIREIPMKTLREKVSVVAQKSVIFSGTIASNIEYGKAIRNNKNMKMAAEIAQAMDFVEGKEDGFESEISQGGANLSGGQKQRLSIARAIARDSEIIVFDDSFSALDSKTDRNLRNALKNNLSDKTLIIVAQRINTIIDADEIVVLEDGKIVGKGTHDELLQKCDVYYEIAKSQLTEEELNHESK
ncbi:ABC transporter [Peptostreptococcus russellii]|uniref:ABC transporter n=1 Tax=Peptostreptococcus russellii TaxID=215200 RepID=A0A2P7Q1R4_9FIRM|nr:ABC transporter ATP-binding protein [Peptostreptococcus russellii]PSJ31911.1 ABC transporter [Peptostreptococcus russellii]